MPNGYLIGEQFANAIKKTIATVDGTPYGGGVTKIPTDLGGDSPFVPKTFRMCTFTGTWAINDDKTCTFMGVTSTPNTVSVTNLVCGMNPTETCEVSVAKNGTAWYVVQPNLTKMPGYSATGTQVMTIVSGNLQWVGTTACS